jgi:hypothetical protein
MNEYEKLGAFYLGRRTGAEPGLLLYDSKDLVTHAVCVGMTGSGKTGLCIGLLEEAAIDGIPALVIDPKGDLANLLLTFPDLDADSFAPWVNADEARIKGLTPEEFAAQQAQLWKNGLAKWDQDGARIARLKAAAEFAIYTPGSDAGIPVSVLSSFAAPDAATMEDREALRDQVAATASSLLGLAGVNADPLQSREHVLISALLDNAWKQGQNLDLATLIAQVQSPPIAKLGVMDLDSFFPAGERFALAMRLNNVLASPGFEVWMQGEPLDPSRLLYTPEGKPRIAILSIAHLSDSERMFFVSLLLNQVLAWTRRQTGTTSLRAIVYMDEIFGYFPPVANPPSKKPLLTLLKQARAFGVGIVLATQNPVDLDYKGLANTGTWFIGRLQTERDKARVLEGLEGAAASTGGRFDRARMEQTLAGLGNRVFLMNNVHEDQPVLFETRWCLSYLRGPLSRLQIKQLMEGRKQSAAPAATVQPVSANAAPPVLPPGIPQWFLPVRGEDPVVYGPRIVGVSSIHFIDDKRGIDEERELVFLAPVGHETIGADWSAAEECPEHPSDFEQQPAPGASFLELPPAAAKSAKYAAWEKTFAAWLFKSQTVTLFRSAEWRLVSEPGETERDFRIRVAQLARERRDDEVEKLRAKLAPKVAALEERKRRALQTLEKEKQQAATQKTQSMIDIGTSVLGALFGRKGSAFSKAGSAARSYNRTAKESADVGRAEETVLAIDQQLAQLAADLEAQIAGMAAPGDPSLFEIEQVLIRPKKANIVVKHVGLAWKPV